MEQTAGAELTKFGLPTNTGNLYWVQDNQVTIPLEGPQTQYQILDPSLTASDFVISFDVTWNTDSWPTCGIWFRAGAAAEDDWGKGDYYQLVILRLSGLPAWDIEYYHNGNYVTTVTQEVQYSNFLKNENGDTNKVVLSAVENEFKVYINGNYEGRYYDYSKLLSSGKFAFTAKQDAGNTKCSFKNTWIWLYK